eukprot:8798297-Ditylum_brightwellii.AAC.1
MESIPTTEESMRTSISSTYCEAKSTRQPQSNNSNALTLWRWKHPRTLQKSIGRNWRTLTKQ